MGTKGTNEEQTNFQDDTVSVNSDESKQTGTSEGNTRLRTRSRKWLFTLNNWEDEELGTIISYFKNKEAKTYVIGEEIGEQGTPHLQGYVHFQKLVEFSTIKKLMPRAHIEMVRGTEEENIRYCSKEGKVHSNIKIKRRGNIIMKTDIIPKPWQREVISWLDLYDKRSIFWVVDPVGNNGKSTLCEHIIKEFKDVMMFCGGKGNDIAYQILESGFMPEICLFDFQRSKEGFISYTALEQIVDGRCYSTKYKGGHLIFPHYAKVICFSNFMPEIQRLSPDRWKIFHLNDGVLTPHKFEESKEDL